jgi:CrcB protein
MVDDVVARPAPRATPPAWLLYLAVLAGGMLGGTTRYLIGVALPSEPGEIPWGIVLVNVLGAFVISLLLAGWSRRGHVAHPWRPFLATGLLGSFTTWSTFIVDTYEMLVAGRDLLASVFVVGATAVGILAAGAGWWAAQQVVPPVERTAAP